ncbi:MAG: hypothetical protein WD022_05905, partial [Balneolaceae bacterium]
MKTSLSFIFVILSVFSLHAQNMTDVSLFMNEDGKQVSFIESPSGDLYQEVGHHGPAIENEW